MDLPPLRIGVIGLEHLHVFEMVGGLVGVGAETVAHCGGGAFDELYVGWRSESQERSVEAIIADSSIDLVVIAAVPSDRADLAVAALDAGKDVLVAKPAVVTSEQLDRVETAARRSGRRWWVFFSERWCNRAIGEAVRLVQAGAIGDLVAITGLAPHRLEPDGRPEWFRSPVTGGGVLVDLAAHQADQVLALAGAGTVEVASATVVATAASPWPGFHDVGRMSLRHTNDDGRVVLSDHHVDWLTPAGLGTWGDVRLLVTGTTGMIEVRSNIDIAGTDGAEHLLIVDQSGTRRVDCSDAPLDWAARLVADRQHDTDSLASLDHTLSACSITLRAQELAERSAP